MTPDEILRFWFEGDRENFQPRWFDRDDAFDDTIRARFGSWLPAAMGGACDGWATTPQGALALLILLVLAFAELPVLLS